MQTQDIVEGLHNNHVYILSSKQSYRPIRVHVAAQLFYKIKCKWRLSSLKSFSYTSKITFCYLISGLVNRGFLALNSGSDMSGSAKRVCLEANVRVSQE